MNILVTGARGMVGTSLVNNLKNIRDGKNKTRPNIHIEEIYEYDLGDEEKLDEYCSKCDFVFNLAGVNRPENPEDFMKGKITLIGCPKLDDVDYSEKLTAIIRDNDIKAVTIIRMEVPCCGGLQRAAETALKNSGKFIPWQVVTISRDGNILE